MRAIPNACATWCRWSSALTACPASASRSCPRARAWPPRRCGWRRAHVAAAAAVATAPMVVEAQWERPFREGRRAVTRVPADALRRHADSGQHGIARALHAGIVCRSACSFANFVHEGNGDLWMDALRRATASRALDPDRGTGQGGDMLAARLRDGPGVSRRIRTRRRGRRTGALPKARLSRLESSMAGIWNSEPVSSSPKLTIR